MVGAAMIHPEVRAVMPLMPAPIVQRDGTAHTAGERHAATRFMATVRQAHPHRTGIITEASLRAKAPPRETRHEYGCRSLRGGTAGDQASVCTPVQATEDAGRVTSSARHERAAGVIHRWRLVHAVPLHAARADVRVNVLAYGEMGPDQVQHCRWGTDVRGSTRNVSTLRRGGRARGNREQEPCKTLKNQGDHCAHTYGHGAQHLAVLVAMLLLLAFVVDQIPPLCGACCQAVWATLGSKRLVWERRRAWGYDEALASMRQRLEALLYGVQKLNPLLAVDASYAPSIASATALQSTTRYPLVGGKLRLQTRGGCFQQAILSLLLAKVSSKNGNGWAKR